MTEGEHLTRCTAARAARLFGDVHGKGVVLSCGFVFPWRESSARCTRGASTPPGATVTRLAVQTSPLPYPCVPLPRRHTRAILSLESLPCPQAAACPNHMSCDFRNSGNRGIAVRIIQSRWCCTRIVALLRTWRLIFIGHFFGCIPLLAYIRDGTLHSLQSMLCSLHIWLVLVFYLLSRWGC